MPSESLFKERQLELEIGKHKLYKELHELAAREIELRCEKRKEELEEKKNSSLFQKKLIELLNNLHNRTK